MLMRCPRCPSQGREPEQPIENFGIVRSRPNGHNTYCRVCIQEKVAIYRAGLREYNRMTKRKPSKLSQPVWRMALKPDEAIQTAMKRGAKTQHEIKRMTHLGVDEIADYLAELYDQDMLCRESLRQRRYRLVG